MEENKKTMLVPTENQFTLSKVKTLKGGEGLDIHYEITEVIGDESYTNKYHVESAKDYHPDLGKLFTALRPIMCRVFNITSFLSMVESEEFKATKKQNELARNFADECLQNIEVRGISLSGKDDNVGVVITGLYTVSNNQRVAINTPRMKFDSETFGFEEELEEIVGSIEREVYAFLFKGKKAQLTLFGDDGEATDEARVDEEQEGVEDNEEQPEEF